MRNVLFVAGCHRSGTSAITRWLSLLGADLPQSLMSPSKDNLLGYWESTVFTKTHDRILQQIGSRWSHVLALSPGALERPERVEWIAQIVKSLNDEFGHAPNPVVKDPRATRLLPLWKAAAAQHNFELKPILVIRNPLEVANSLKKRDNMPLYSALMLWLRCTLEAEEHSRSQPRAVVDFRSLLHDWRGVAERTEKILSLTFKRTPQTDIEIDNFLSDKLVHQHVSKHKLEDSDPILDWVNRTYNALLSIATDGENDGPLDVLDSVRQEITIADAYYIPMLDELKHEIRKRNKVIAETTTLVETLQVEAERVQTLESEITNIRRHNQTLEAEIMRIRERLWEFAYLFRTQTNTDKVRTLALNLLTNQGSTVAQYIFSSAKALAKGQKRPSPPKSILTEARLVQLSSKKLK